MKLVLAAAAAILLASGMVYAQDNSSNTQGRDTDPGNYLNGPKTQDFYTDESRTNVRPPAEFKQVWDKMNDTDRADIKQACSANRDVSYNPFCTNVGGM